MISSQNFKLANIFAATCLLLTCPAAVLAESVYVQSAKAQLKAQARMDAADVAPLARGDELEVLGKEGIWFQTRITGGPARGKTGWVSKLFVSNQRPIGYNTLLTDVQEDLSKSSRRRTSSYDVSAAARGLTAVNTRSREGQGKYRPDFYTLELIEKQQPTPQQLAEFQARGKLTAAPQ